jgi:hypothetical protein
MPHNLGALERKPDSRDFLLGSIQAPVSIPPSFAPDISWLLPNWQGELPACGSHAASHLQAILEHQNSPATAQRYTPRYSWIKIKQIDGFPLEDGTDMRSIFKSLTNDGADDFEPLMNDVSLPLATYSDPSAVLPYMDTTAANNKIISYAFGNTDFQSICQHIYQNKAVLLLIKCDDAWWGTATPSFTSPKYGHFIVAYGFSPTGIKIVDSSDKDFPLKEISKEFITSQFIIEAGTAIDIPPAQVQAIINTAQNVINQVPAAPIPTEQKLDIISQLKTLISFLASLFQSKVGASPQPTMFSNESKFWNWLVVSSEDPTKVAATVKGAAGVLVTLLALTIHGPDFSSIPSDVYTFVIDAFGVFSAALALVGIGRKIYNTFFSSTPTQ